MRPKMLIIDMLPAADQSSRHTFETWTDISPRRVKTRPRGSSQRPVSTRWQTRAIRRLFRLRTIRRFKINLSRNARMGRVLPVL